MQPHSYFVPIQFFLEARIFQSILRAHLQRKTLNFTWQTPLFRIWNIVFLLRSFTKTEVSQRNSCCTSQKHVSHLPSRSEFHIQILVVERVPIPHSTGGFPIPEALKADVWFVDHKAAPPSLLKYKRYVSDVTTCNRVWLQVLFFVCLRMLSFSKKLS